MMLSEDSLRRQIRVIAILHAYSGSSWHPTAVRYVHAVSYFVDALAHAWHLAPLEDLVLKSSDLPRSLQMQMAIDRLVGAGVVIPSEIRFTKDGGRWRFEANLRLNEDLAAPILEVLASDDGWSRELLFVREIASAVQGLGQDALVPALMLEASYADPQVDWNSVVDLDPDQGKMSRTMAMSERLMDLARTRIGRELSDSELASLYVRHLYGVLVGRA